MCCHIYLLVVFFLLKSRRPPKSPPFFWGAGVGGEKGRVLIGTNGGKAGGGGAGRQRHDMYMPVPYKHPRAHETPGQSVCRLLLEKKKKNKLISVTCAL